MTLDTKALEACRRCGQKDAEVFANDGWFTVECNNCPCRTSGADRTADEAIDAWNRSATPSRNDILEEAARKLGKDKRLSLAYHDKVYGDDDDLPTHGKWVIWRETGNINDREWEVVSSGDTPAAAIRALVKP